jgi:glycosyltransferase involved in cell wall biosynthesis
MIRECSVIIPVYNEEQNIRNVVTELMHILSDAGINYEIIVVDDCSTDKTSIICKDLNVKLITHPANVGYGAAIKTGMAKALYNIVGVIDADGTYKTQDLVLLLENINEYDMVVGARQNMHIWDSFWKYIGRKIYLCLVGYVTGIKVPDANSGLRVFKKTSVMPFYSRLCQGFSFTTTLTLAMLCQGCFVKFIPIHYRKREGKSKVKLIKDTLGTAQILFQEIMYYNPIKAILPFSMFCVLIFFINAIAYIFNKQLFYYMGALVMLFASVLIFVLGLIADLISQGIKKKS